MALFHPVMLTGDYLTVHDRQLQAFTEQCVCVVEFHFNSGVPAAHGGEVHYQQADAVSHDFANAMWAAIAATGLPPHGNHPVKSTATEKRSRWIDHYLMPTILLEPLFISNVGQADWLQTNRTYLADAIADCIRSYFLTGGHIGLSAGHAGKSTPDPGAPCVLGGSEADYTVDLSYLVSQRL